MLLNESPRSLFITELQALFMTLPIAGRAKRKGRDMFGFIFGTACLIGLTVLLVRGRRHRWYGGYRQRRGYMLGAVLDRLETTPGQEKVIRDAVEEFTTSASGARREFRASREDLAKAIRNEALDSRSLEDAFRRHDGSIGDLRNSFVS